MHPPPRPRPTLSSRPPAVVLHVGLVLSVAIGACSDPKGGPQAGADSGLGGDDTGAVGLSTAVVMTSYEGVGALATVDVETGAVQDERVTVSSDSDVVTLGGAVYQLNRSDFDSVRVYAPGQWSEPTLEIGLQAGANAWDAALCGGDLFVSQYETSALAVFDPDTGVLAGQVDLSAFDDGDGYPEVGSMVVRQDRLYVAVQQLDRDGGWVANGGRVVEVDCAARATIQDWEVGPNPTISGFASDEARLLVQTGVYFAADGGLAALDVETGVLSAPFLLESDLEADIMFAALAPGDAHGVVVTGSLSAPTTYDVGCFSMQDTTESGSVSVTVAETLPAFVGGLAMDDRGRAWVSFQAPSWGDPDAQPGVARYDASTCARVPDFSAFILDPGSIAFY
jgi:hypothetical protein